MNFLIKYLDSVAASALPEGDLDMLHSNSLSVVPLTGHSIKRSWYHQDLISKTNASDKVSAKLLLLPDVGRFKIELKPFDYALLSNGIVSRYPSSITIFKNRNRRMNRYLIYMYWKLYNSRGNSRLYWSYSLMFIRRSSCYLSACMNSVNGNLYRTLTMKDYRRLLIRLNRMRGQFSLKSSQFANQRLSLNHNQHPLLQPALMKHYIRFFRVYIPKGDTVRPLGVPTLAWRIFQKMLLNPLLTPTVELLPKEFHGYLPKRGTGSAWKQVLMETIPSANVLEIDFKQFFPSVDTDHLLNFMINKWNIPIPVALYLYLMNQSLPIFLEGRQDHDLPGEITFTPSHQMSLISDQAKTLAFNQKDPIIKGLKTSHLADMDAYTTEAELSTDYTIPGSPTLVKHNKFVDGNMLTYSPGNTRAWVEAQRVTPVDPNRSLRKSLGIEFKGNIGLPQGGTLSPYLSILYLQEVLKACNVPKEVSFVFYADDGIFYSENYAVLRAWFDEVSKPINKPGYLFFYNLRINFDKSHWAKVEGKWQKSVKFLGIVYIPPTADSPISRLVAATRNGSTLEYNLDDLTHFEFAQRLISNPKATTIRTRLRELTTYKQTPVTKAVIRYYETLHTIYSENLEKASYLEFAYLLYKGLTRGLVFYLFTFFSRLGSNVMSKEDALIFASQVTQPYEDIQENFKIESFTNVIEDVDELSDFLSRLDKLLYSSKVLMDHVLTSERLQTHLQRSPDQSVSPLSYEPTASFIEDHDDPASSLFNQYTREYLPSIVRSNILMSEGQSSERIPHLYVYLSTILSPLKYLSLTFNPANYFDKDEETLGFLRKYIGKHRWRNLVTSRYFGLIFSRLYIGSYTLASFTQDFTFKYQTGSIAERLERMCSFMGYPMNIFIGSSYALHETVLYLSFLKLSPGRSYKFLSKGILPMSSWDVRKSEAVEAKSRPIPSTLAILETVEKTNFYFTYFFVLFLCFLYFIFFMD